MNYMNFSLFQQTPVTIPTASREKLEKAIKTSDFVIADDKGVHRMIGLKYNSDLMPAPKITFICMRHEMAVAKQQVFALGKRIFYNSEMSAKLFNQTVGDYIPLETFEYIVKIYSKILWREKEEKTIRITKYGQLFIRGKKLPALIRLHDIERILGKPDDSKINVWNARKERICIWIEWGIVAYSFIGSYGVVNHLRFFIKNEKSYKIPNILLEKYHFDVINDSIHLNISTFEKSQFIDICFDDVSFAIFRLTIDSDDESILAAIKEDKNRVDRIKHFTALHYAVIYQQKRIVKMLIEKGVNLNPVDFFGDTPLSKIANVPDSEVSVYSEIKKMLIEAGAV